MSESLQPTESENPASPVPCGTMRLYTPRGVQVNLPVPCSGDQTCDYTVALNAANAALEAGWLVQAPGLEAGENVEEIGFAVRKEKEGRDGMVPVMDLYAVGDGMKFSFITIYLNDQNAVREFEAVSGLSVHHMPLYEGSDKIERGKSAKTDAKVKPFVKPARLVWGHNPKYDAKEAEAAKAGGKMYTVPKKKFLRWADAAGAPATSPSANGKATTEAAVDQVVLKQWQTNLAVDVCTLDMLNDMLPGLSRMNPPTKKACWEAAKTFAEESGFVFDTRTRKYFAPEDVSEEVSRDIPF